MVPQLDGVIRWVDRIVVAAGSTASLSRTMKSYWRAELVLAPLSSGLPAPWQWGASKISSVTFWAKSALASLAEK